MFYYSKLVLIAIIIRITAIDLRTILKSRLRKALSRIIILVVNNRKPITNLSSRYRIIFLSRRLFIVFLALISLFEGSLVYIRLLSILISKNSIIRLIIPFI